MSASTQPAIETIRERAEEALNDDAVMVPIVELTAMARDVLTLLAALSAVEADLRRKDVLLKEAVWIVNGTVDHLFLGSCPDPGEGIETRDPDCPACQWLDATAALAVSPSEPVPQQAEEER